MDIFDSRTAQAMLIGREENAFDDPDYIYELKLDGDRCLAYLDGRLTSLLSKRGQEVIARLPELANLHKQVKQRCILDGELIVGAGRKKEFEFVRSRMTASNKYSIARLATERPASFVVHDILYLERENITARPLLERKALLERNIEEGNGLVLTRYIEEQGQAFYRLAVQQGMEGVVAKRRDSPYLMGKRTRDWSRFKNWADDDFVVCGYWPSDKANVVSLVLGQYRPQAAGPAELVYKSYVVLGRQNPDYAKIDALPRHAVQTAKWGSSPDKHPKTIWLEPLLVCKVEYICLTSKGGLRQPIYRGLREDKLPEECIEQDPASWPHTC